jgi:putative flippase GtrA
MILGDEAFAAKNQWFKLKEFIHKYAFSNALRQQIFLFLLVGGVCYGISMVMLIFLVETVQMEVNLANLLSSLLAIYVAYVLNGRFIFERGKYTPTKEISAFFVFSLLGLLLNVAMMYLMTTYTSIWYVISKTVITVVVAGFNFTTRKYIIFNG